jgi:archaemetzincin
VPLRFDLHAVVECHGNPEGEPMPVGPIRSVGTRVAAIFLIALAFVLISRRLSESPDEWGYVTPPPETVEAYLPQTPEARRMIQAVEALRPLHEKQQHPPALPDQTFRLYVIADPYIREEKRTKVVVRPLAAAEIAPKLTHPAVLRYLGAFFGATVEVARPISLGTVTGGARRTHPTWGDRQVHSLHILEKVLVPSLPDDAITHIGVTTDELWPNERYNYVFGQALLRRSAAVWSTNRLGMIPEHTSHDVRALLRNLKIATHEASHTLSMTHCVRYMCDMQATKHVGELDACPLWMCAECAMKVCWALRLDPAQRYRDLAACCRDLGLEREARFFTRSAAALDERAPLDSGGHQ